MTSKKASGVRTIPIDRAMKSAVDFHRVENFKEAERLYRSVLLRKPTHPDAHHNLGVLHVQFGRLNESLPHFEMALKSNPHCHQYWISYADTLAQSGQLALAGQLLDRARASGMTEGLLEQMRDSIARSGTTALSKAYRARNFSQAEQLGRSLTLLYPSNAMAWQILGASMMQQGRAEEALAPMCEAVRIVPENAESQSSLGAVLCNLKRYEEAEACQLRAIALKPEFAGAYSNLGYVQSLLGKLEESEANCRRAIELDPLFAQAYNNLVTALIYQEKLVEAEMHCRRAIELDPNYAEAYNNLGSISYKLGRAIEAESAFRQAIAIKPDFAEAYNNLGLTQYDLKASVEAEGSYLAALALNPDYAEAHNNLANLCQGLGRIEEAREHYERALAINPDYIEALRNLANVKTYTQGDPQIQLLKQIVQNPRSDNASMHANFALGKISEDLGKDEEAFVYYKEGNRLAKIEQDYHISEDQTLFDWIRTSFDKLPPVDQVQPDRSNPILIVGMPRSGTSLVEQILASHSAVRGAGELKLLDREVQKHVVVGQQAIDLSRISRNITAGYFDGIDKLAEGRAYVTDKMPQNFLWIGFLLLANPDIRIVHIHREPMATCWSLFRLYFPVKGLGFAYDLSDLAIYYRLYEDLMAFWHEKFPGRIYDLDYEKLTEHQEEETRKLLDYCGLPWEEECLSFHETKRVVKTASTAQIRNKMYQGSSEAWKKFEKHLAPLKTELGIQ